MRCSPRIRNVFETSSRRDLTNEPHAPIVSSWNLRLSCWSVWGWQSASRAERWELEGPWSWSLPSSWCLVFRNRSPRHFARCVGAPDRHLRAMQYYRAGLLDVRAAAFIASGFVFGALGGAAIVPYIPQIWLKRAFATLLVYCANPAGLRRSQQTLQRSIAGRDRLDGALGGVRTSPRIGTFGAQALRPKLRLPRTPITTSKSSDDSPSEANNLAPILLWCRALTRESSTSIRHLPALDGLRGLALLGVLFFHAGRRAARRIPGRRSVLRFVGFLITSLLLAEHRATGRIALKPFWIRRARRLFPALLSLMPAIAMYGRFFAKPSELASLRSDALATLGYVANWRAIFAHKSYWELFTAPSPLEHTWSLSIEEQFYVVWPLTVALVLRKLSSRFLLVITLILSGLSMAAMVLLYDPERTSRVYLGTDTRAASILFGAALAILVTARTTSTDLPFAKSTVWILDGLGLLSLAGLGYAWVKLTGDTPLLYRGGFWLTEMASLVLILCAISGSRSLIARLLSFKPLRWVGTISYGLYL